MSGYCSCLFVFSFLLGFRLRSTMTHWKSGMAPQPPLHWLVNTMAPKHLISWFPRPTSCSCCSRQTTVARQQASASDMKVRLICGPIGMFTLWIACRHSYRTAKCVFFFPMFSEFRLEPALKYVITHTRVHSSSWPCFSAVCACVIVWCDSQVWKWSQTLVSIPASQSMVVAMAAAFPSAPASHLHVTQDTHWVIRSQLFVSRIISGVTRSPVVMVRISLSFISLLLIEAHSGLTPGASYSKKDLSATGLWCSHSLVGIWLESEALLICGRSVNQSRKSLRCNTSEKGGRKRNYCANWLSRSVSPCSFPSEDKAFSPLKCFNQNIAEQKKVCTVNTLVKSRSKS